MVGYGSVSTIAKRWVNDEDLASLSLLKVRSSPYRKLWGISESEGELDLVKSFNKFNNLHSHCKRYRDIFVLLSRTSIIEKFPNEKILVEKYIGVINKDIEDFFAHAPPAQRLVDIHPLIPKEKKDEVLAFLKYYNKAKKASLVHTIINTCGNLVSYKTYLKDKDKLDDKFITKSSMLTFEPVIDLVVNFKHLYISDLLTENEKKFILLTLHKIYIISVDTYEEYSKVDIDTEQFVRAVRITVDKLKKQIPRCEEAFQKILDSTDLLKDNYNDYYKDYVGSQNSMIIAENFIQDVAGTVDKSPKLALQFRKIIQHLRDMTNKLVAQDPRYKDTFGSLLDHADNSYSEIKKSLAEDGEDMEQLEKDDADGDDGGIGEALSELTKGMKIGEDGDTEGTEDIMASLNQVTQTFKESLKEAKEEDSSASNNIPIYSDPTVKE